MAEKTCRALTLYWSAGGNTRKVAEAIQKALTAAGVEATLHEMAEGLEVDYFAYDLVLIGAPVYAYLPPEPVIGWLKAQQQRGTVLPAAPERSGHYGVVFCTYGGPHTGIREAVPMLKYVGQFLEHLGIPVVDEWAVVGEFHQGHETMNLAGRLGDLRGRPNASDLAEVRGKVLGLLRRLQHSLPVDPARLQAGGPS